MTIRATKRAPNMTANARRPTRVGDDNNNTMSTSATSNTRVFPAFPTANSFVAASTVDRCPSAAHGASSAASMGAAVAAAGYQYVDMSMYEDYLRPIYKDGDVVLEVECGDNQGLLYLSRLCQGSKGPCILFNNMWLTPNEFQYISGRETAKDWKRSIRHHGKSMKLLLSKGILAVHPPICDCDGCRISSPVSASKVKCTGLGQAKHFSSVASPQPTLAIPSGPFATSAAVYPTSESRAGRVSESSKRTLIAQIPTDNCVPISRRGSNGRSKKTLLGLPACGYSDHVHELQVLIAQTQKQAERLQKDIDSVKKTEFVNKSPEPAEKKRESRLTSIIDQLLSNKAKGLKEEAAKSNSNSDVNVKSNALDSNDDQINSDDNSSEDRREISSTSSAISSTSGDSVSSSVSLESGQSEISTGSSFDENGTANFQDTHHLHQPDTVEIKAEGSADSYSPMPEVERKEGKSGTRSRKKTKMSINNDQQNGYEPTASSVRRSVECAVADSLVLDEFAHEKNASNKKIKSLDDVMLVDPAKIKRESHTPDFDSPKSSPICGASSYKIQLNHMSSPLGLEHLSPALVAGACATPPVLKQMEQMVTRNYSDIMRSLAAKYNKTNNSNHDRYNSLERKYDGRFPTPPLLGLTKSEVEGVRENENHSAPPILGEQRSPGAGTVFPCSLAPVMIDMSSTQALLSMVRSASAQNASQLESYLRGSVKRHLGDGETPRTDPLDLTTNNSKKPRMDAFSITYDSSAACITAAAALNLRLPGSELAAATSMAAVKPLRDFRELLSKREEHNQADPAPRTPGTSPKPGEARTPKDELLQSKMKYIDSLPCVSLCTDRSCTSASQAEEVGKWTVDQVCKFVASIDTCTEYVQTFREQSIDGMALPMLTEEHLINNMNMKLGPALKLRSTLAKKIGHCAMCMHCIHCHENSDIRRPDSN